MEQVSNPFKAMKDVFVKPNRVFATIKDTDNWSWLPFIFISVVTALPLYYYFNFVDFEWYRELVMQASMGDLSPSEEKVLRNSMHQGQILWISVFGGVLSIVITHAVLALYLYMMAKADDECIQDYTDWYGFTWWTSMPAIVFSLLSLVIIFLAQDTQLSPVSIIPTSLAFILGVDMTSSWFSLAQTIRLESIWVIYLTTVGLSQWTLLGKNKIYAIAIAPYAIIWAVWALFVMI